MICLGTRESKETQLTHCDGESVCSDSSFEPMAEINEESDISLGLNDSKLCCGD